MKGFRPSYGPGQRRPPTRRPVNAKPAFWRIGPAPHVQMDAIPCARDANLARLEAVLFLADEPVPLRRLTEAAGLRDGHQTRKLLDTLREYYDRDGCAFQIADLAGGFQLLTRPAYHPWLIRLRRTSVELRLSSAALETLAVIAYRQPVTRADVEAVRGVSITEIIRLLMEKGLVRVTGRHDSLGRPQLYGTTKKFLQMYGLNSLADLPPLEESR